tara:strand:+ start:1714 stop:2160 length:447 start_codon:yes stop_codon:yes gene_type:complete
MKTLKRIKKSIEKGSSSIYHKLMKEEHDIESFFKDEKIQKKQLSILKKDLRKNAKKINEEVQLEKDAILLLKKHAAGKKLTSKEEKIVKTSLIDICKVVPSLGIFLLPGGMILLPLVSKILPFDLMPSAFQTKKKKPKRSKKKKTKRR